jgi:hypothetical protein
MCYYKYRSNLFLFPWQQVEIHCSKLLEALFSPTLSKSLFVCFLTLSMHCVTTHKFMVSNCSFSSQHWDLCHFLYAIWWPRLSNCWMHAWMGIGIWHQLVGERWYSLLKPKQPRYLDFFFYLIQKLLTFVYTPTI